MLNNIETIQ